MSDILRREWQVTPPIEEVKPERAPELIRQPRSVVIAELGAKALRSSLYQGERVVHTVSRAARSLWRHRSGITVGAAVGGGLVAASALVVANGDAHYADTLKTMMNSFMGVEGPKKVPDPNLSEAVATGGVSGALSALSAGLHMIFAKGKRDAAEWTSDPNAPPLELYRSPRCSEPRYFLQTTRDFEQRAARAAKGLIMAEQTRRLLEQRAYRRQLTQEMIETWGGAPAATTRVYQAASYDEHAHTKERYFPTAMGYGNGLYRAQVELDAVAGDEPTLDLGVAGKEVLASAEALLRSTAEHQLVPVA